MFDIELLISAGDLKHDVLMDRHRAALDGGAKAHHRSSKFVKEEIAPYIIKTRKPGETQIREIENKETREYRILRRFYE